MSVRVHLYTHLCVSVCLCVRDQVPPFLLGPLVVEAEATTRDTPRDDPQSQPVLGQGPEFRRTSSRWESSPVWDHEGLRPGTPTRTPSRPLPPVAPMSRTHRRPEGPTRSKRGPRPSTRTRNSRPFVGIHPRPLSEGEVLLSVPEGFRYN